MSVVLDVVLALLVAALALRLLLIDDPFEAVVLFVAFGLAMALVWVRLGAVDVALAEAALGAGVTGALLVNTLRRLQVKAPEALRRRERGVATAAMALLTAVAAGAAAVAALRAPRAPEPLGPRLATPLAETAVANPVTGVLLDLRAYDTLLEIGVLVAAMVAVWALERGRAAVPPPATAAEEPVLAATARRIVPVTVITAVYLTWVGASEPGGAFQAGSLLAGSAVLLLAAGLVRPWAREAAAARVGIAAGLFVFAGLALATAVLSGSMLRWPAPGYPWILALEAVLTLGIAAVLAELFIDVPARPVERR